MEQFNLAEFIGITGVLFGLGAYLMGQAIAETWRPAWQNVAYGFVLAAFNHFIDCALFGEAWTSVGHYLVDAAFIIAVALFAHRVTAVRKMVAQYPWLYERAGLMNWRERAGTDMQA